MPAVLARMFSYACGFVFPWTAVVLCKSFSRAGLFCLDDLLVLLLLSWYLGLESANPGPTFPRHHCCRPSNTSLGLNTARFFCVFCVSVKFRKMRVLFSLQLVCGVWCVVCNAKSSEKFCESAGAFPACFCSPFLVLDAVWERVKATSSVLSAYSRGC